FRASCGLKINVFEQCVPVMTHGSETWWIYEPHKMAQSYSAGGESYTGSVVIDMIKSEMRKAIEELELPK
ncbi:jg26199, partial [Pararge aegeria aegeria]